ncbi:MAG: DUF4102 domain-containing protein [Moraxellaceae bacterium]|nr:DUF4102 domain-containing protein [Moraxellaceae bacterium]
MDDKNFNFTKAKLDTLPLPDKDRETYFDKTVQELQLRITSKGAKSFVVVRRVNNRVVRTTLGRYPAMTIDQARTEARKQLGLMVTGIDPNKAKKAERVKGVTLSQCLTDYLSIRASLAESTKKGYHSNGQQSFNRLARQATQRY